MNAIPLHNSYFPIAWRCLSVLLAVLIGLPSAPAGAVQNVTERAEAGVSINDVERGSLLVRAAEGEALKPAPLLDTAVDMNINAMIARVKVRQTFTYHGSDWVHGIYVFPLPENAAVDRLRMQVGERIIEGRIEARAQARKTFESARKAGRKATLVEQQRDNLFTTSVANIGPGDTVVVEIEYQHTLAYNDGWFSLRFPLTVGVRYIPGHAPVAGFDGGGWSYNTNQVADASSITPPMSTAGEGHDNPVSITIELNAGMPLKNIESSYHTITQRVLGGDRYRVELDHGTVPADRDFELRYRPAPEHAPRAAFFRQDVGDDSYGLLVLVPPEAAWARRSATPRELVLVIDTSGSMHGNSINQAREALLFGLDRLHSGDSFNIVQFNSVTSRFQPASVPATAAHIAAARAYVRHLSADGGTEMAAALNAVLDADETHQRLRQVVFITDGSVGNEAALFRIIDERLGASRLFTVGIGSAPNSHFMSEAAHIGRGTFTYIGDLGEVQDKMSALFKKLEFPVLGDIRLDGGADRLESWPDPLRDLYVDEPLLVSLRLGGQDAISLSGTLAGKPWSTRVPVAGGGNAEGLDVAWARAKIASLERSLARGADRDQVRAAITTLGLDHHLVTRHTSLVAVDVTPSRPEHGAARDAAVPNKMPAGWAMAVPAARLPQTATPLLLYIWLGFGSALAALLARRRGLRA